jgi:hypothetical protein
MVHRPAHQHERFGQLRHRQHRHLHVAEDADHVHHRPERGLQADRSLRIDVGANNLFDHGAKTLPTVYTGTAYRPLNGNVYASPASFTPWGINGGYYGRVTFNF